MKSLYRALSRSVPETHWDGIPAAFPSGGAFGFPPVSIGGGSGVPSGFAASVILGPSAERGADGLRKLLQLNFPRTGSGVPDRLLRRGLGRLVRRVVGVKALVRLRPRQGADLRDPPLHLRGRGEHGRRPRLRELAEERDPPRLAERPPGVVVLPLDDIRHYVTSPTPVPLASVPVPAWPAGLPLTTSANVAAVIRTHPTPFACTQSVIAFEHGRQNSSLFPPSAVITGSRLLFSRAYRAACPAVPSLIPTSPTPVFGIIWPAPACDVGLPLVASAVWS